jgi:hypothetical protein
MRPSAPVRITIFPKSLGSARRPSVLTVSWYAVPGGAGCWPITPAATCTFCSRSAATTSPAVMPSSAIRSGSSHTRML